MAEKTTRIAIVEDDVAIVQMYRLKFEADGYEVKTAGDGVAGLKLIEEFDPHIVLLDIMMPQMSGIDVLAHLRKNPKTKSLKVVILTNMGDAETASKVFAMNATDYIVKAELTPREVSEKVKKLLEKSTEK